MKRKPGGLKNSERLERLLADKKRIRAEYSRFPWMNWFRMKNDEKPEKISGLEFEKNDVLAIILAVLSMVLPWILLLAAGAGLIIVVLGLLF